MAIPNYAMGQVLGTDLARCVGLDPAQVKDMVIRIVPDDIVTLEITLLPTEEQLEETIMKFDLVERIGPDAG